MPLPEQREFESFYFTLMNGRKESWTSRPESPVPPSGECWTLLSMRGWQMILLSPLCGQALPERLVSCSQWDGNWKKTSQFCPLWLIMVNSCTPEIEIWLRTWLRVVTQALLFHRNRTFSIDNVLERRQPPLPSLPHFPPPLSHFPQGSHAADGQCTLLSRVGLSI